MDLQTGSTLVGQVLGGRYQVTRFIGQGGMGSVYEASPLQLARKRLAVKVLLQYTVSDEATYARFRREAEAASAMGHPNIVQVFDFDVTPDGAPFIVMEFLEGMDLQRALGREGGLSRALALSVVEQVASALEAAHREGIVHRDVKPENIFLVETGTAAPHVKLLDFGLCKLANSHGTMLTATSAIFGTPGYMSPEQAEGMVSEIDASTDIFALGVVAYECLTGFHPFQAPSVPATLYNVCHLTPQSPTELVPSLPAALDAVMSRALAKRKVDRFESASELARALRAAVDGAAPVERAEAASFTLPPGTVPPRRALSDLERTSVVAKPARRPSRVALAVAALGLLAIATATALLIAFAGDRDHPAATPAGPLWLDAGAPRRLVARPSPDAQQPRAREASVDHALPDRASLAPDLTPPAKSEPRRPVRPPRKRKEVRYETL